MQKLYKNKPTKYLEKASLTVELSLLMPGIMMSIILVIYMSFYYHDKCVIERLAYSYAKWEANSRDEDEIIACDLNKGLLGKWNIEENTEENEDEVIVYISGTMFENNYLLFGYINEALFSMKTCVKARKIQEVEYIRNKNEN